MSADLLKELVQKHASEKVEQGWLLAFGRELLSECLKVVEDERGGAVEAMSIAATLACERIAHRLRELASAGEGKNG
jgi:hypothetical protein